MKKRIPVLLCLLLVCLAGCGTGDPSLALEAGVWQLATLQSVEQEGQIVAHGPGTGIVPDTSVELQLTCKAAEGLLTFSNETNDRTCTGSYRLIESGPQSNIYEITVEDTDGMAVVSYTTRQDGGELPTLALQLGDWTGYFALAEML